MPKFILLNGPPRSGKDTAAKMILNGDSINFDYLVNHMKFSAPLKEAFAAVMEKDINDFVVEYYEDHKEEIIPFLGVSFRQWQIDFSEKFMKPLYGNDVLGRLFINRIQADLENGPDENWVYVISDCGFQVEVDHILKTFPPADVLLIRLFREGCTFVGDSRSYVIAPGCTEIDLRNNSNLTIFEDILTEHIKAWLAE